MRKRCGPLTPALVNHILPRLRTEIVGQQQIGDIPPAQGCRRICALESEPIVGNLDGDTGAGGIEVRRSIRSINNCQIRVIVDFARASLVCVRQRLLYTPRGNRPQKIEPGGGHAVQFVAKWIETGLELVGQGA